MIIEIKVVTAALKWLSNASQAEAIIISDSQFMPQIL